MTSSPPHVGIVGLGYVGLPLAVAFAQAGCPITAVDLDAKKVAALQSRRSYIEDVPSAALEELGDRITATTKFGPLHHADVIVLCVPTPLNANREPELEPLRASAESVERILRTGQLVVLESTTYPGTTRELLKPILERSGLGAGTDFSLAFSPERVDPGRTDYTIRNTPKVVGGLTPDCLARAEEFYGLVCDDLVPVSTPEAAELAKLLENIFRSVNIALVNEMAMLCERMSIDIWEVVDAAATKPYGFMRFEPGPGMGGHCLPVDPFYLAWRARKFDMSTEFIELAGKVNQQMPYYCVQRIERTLNDAGKATRGARVLILGASYKAGVGDMRESPSLKIIALLEVLGAEVSYSDSFVPALPDFDLASVAVDKGVADADLVVIVTAHPDVDHEAIAAGIVPVLDLRGVTRSVDAPNRTLL